MKTGLGILMAVVLTGGGVESASQARSGTAERKADMAPKDSEAWLADSVKGSFGPLEVGMSRERLAALVLPTEWGRMEQEGESYESVKISAPNNIMIKCVLSDDVVYRCSSESMNLRDREGLGVGSTLRVLKVAYADGMLIVGSEHGRYANFVTGGPLMFTMDMSRIGGECFELETCAFDEGELRVLRVVVTHVQGRSE